MTAASSQNAAAIDTPKEVFMQSRSGCRSSRRLAALIVGATMPFLAAAAWANDDPSPQEALQLPKYCHKQYGIPSSTPMPTELCGHLMNHFCSGLVFLNRAGDVTAPKWKRQSNARRAKSGLDYTKKGMPANCPLAGEVDAAHARLRIVEMFTK